MNSTTAIDERNQKKRTNFPLSMSYSMAGMIGMFNPASHLLRLPPIHKVATSKAMSTRAHHDNKGMKLAKVEIKPQ
jgi:hypothetical protein